MLPRSKSLITGFITLSLLVACVNEEVRKPEPVAKDMYDRDFEVFLPESLWSQLEGTYQLLEEKRRTLPEAKKRDFQGITVHLEEVTGSPLRGKNFMLRFGGRGGLLDLAEFVSGAQGQFRVRIEPAEWDKFAAHKVFYLSHAKKRTWQDREIGAGCENFMDITRFFNSTWNKTGADAFLTDQHYVSVWAGTYFLAGASEGDLALGQITITDSRFPDLYCRQPTAKP